MDGAQECMISITSLQQVGITCAMHARQGSHPAAQGSMPFKMRPTLTRISCICVSQTCTQGLGTPVITSSSKAGPVCTYSVDI